MLILKLVVVIGWKMSDILISEKIKIKAVSSYIPEKSNSVTPLYFFSYTVKIKNNDTNDIKLLTRHWDILDANGNLHVVNGEGVIGEKPIIKSGQIYKYTSFCPLKTEFGSMKGFYTFKNDLGYKLQSFVPEFSLIVPNMVN